MPGHPWGATDWSGYTPRVRTTVAAYQKENVPLRRGRPKKRSTFGSWEWWRRLLPPEHFRRPPGVYKRWRPWIPWYIYRRLMNPPHSWKRYASGWLYRWCHLRGFPSANPRRFRRLWVEKPQYKWRKKIRYRRRYLVTRSEQPLGRRRRHNATYNPRHGFTVRFRRMPNPYRRRRLRLRRLYTSGYNRLRWRQHWPAADVDQFLFRLGRGPRRRRLRRGRQRVRLSPYQVRHHHRRFRLGQHHRNQPVPSVGGWAPRLWGLFIRKGRKIRVENLSRRLRRGGFHPGALYFGGWSHLGTRNHRRGGATLKVPTMVTPAKAVAVVRRWVTRVVQTRGERTWTARVAAVLEDPAGVVKLRDTHNGGALFNVALL